MAAALRRAWRRGLGRGRRWARGAAGPAGRVVAGVPPSEEAMRRFRRRAVELVVHGRGRGPYGRHGVPQLYVARHGQYGSAVVYNLLAFALAAVGSALYGFRKAHEEEVPLVGRAHFVAFSPESEARFGRWVAAAVVRRNRLAGRVLDEEHPDARLVARVGQRVAAAVCGSAEELDEWRYVVLDREDEVNAVCYPGGQLVVYSGLLQRLRAEPFSGLSLEEKLAVVLSHEIGHVVARHTNESISRRLFVSVPFWMLVLNASPTLAAAYKFGLEMPSSRQHENEADFLGLLLLAASGYDPRLSPRFWSCGADIFEDKGFLADYVSTHPEHASRAAHTTMWMRQANEVRRFAEGEGDGAAPGGLLRRLIAAGAVSRPENLVLEV